MKMPWICILILAAMTNQSRCEIVAGSAKFALGHPHAAIRSSAAGTPLPWPPWLAVLRRMPLGGETRQLDRTNCISLMLHAFQSNDVVKAIIFMPGATDELYFFRRAHATLSCRDPSLADAIVALTNQTYIQADFSPPFLILHTTQDPLIPMTVVRNKTTAEKLKNRVVPGLLLFNDCEWDELRSALKRKLSVSLRPFANAPASWHFYRNSFAECGLTQWQLLEAIAMSGQTRFTVHWLTADFELDTRAGPTPGFH